MSSGVQVDISPQKVLVGGVAGWAARGLRTGDFGRPSVQGFAVGAVNSVLFQVVFQEAVAKSDKKGRKLMAVLLGATSVWLTDRLIIPETQKQANFQEAIVESVVGNQAAEIIEDSLESFDPPVEG
jgi:uncharacterized membrane protein YeaQ/YmgE (transglycosylase-associated protein family)